MPDYIKRWVIFKKPLKIKSFGIKISKESNLIDIEIFLIKHKYCFYQTWYNLNKDKEE